MNHSKGNWVGRALYPYRFWLLLQTLNVLLWGFLRLADSYASKLLVDTLHKLTPGFTVGTVLYWPIGLYVVVYGAWNLSYRLHDLIWRHVKPGLKKRLNSQMLQHLTYHAAGFYQQHLTGSLGNRISETAQRVPDLIEISTDSLFNAFCTFLIAIGGLWILAPAFACIIGCWVIFFLGSLWILYPSMRKMNKHIAEKNTHIIGHAVNIMQNIAAVRLFTGERLEQKFFNRKLIQTMRVERKRDLWMACFHTIQGVGFLFAQLACFWMLIQGFEAGTFTAGDFMFVIDINFSIVFVFWPLSETIEEGLDNLGYIQQGIKVIFAPHDIQDKPQALPLVASQGTITYENISFSYSKRKYLFENLSITIPAKQQVALLGYSGSGKTSFVQLLLRLFEIKKGRIMIDGQDICHVTQTSLRAAITIVPQEPYLFQRSIQDNIRYGLPDASKAEVIEAAKRAHAHDFISQLPQGYRTLIGEQGASLSGGQRQRIAIARAFLKPAPILIMDEATSNLDTPTEILIQQSLEDLRTSRPQTTLVIAHRLTSLPKMDRILVFEQGRIIEDGHHETLVTAGGCYQNLWKNHISQ